MITTYTCPECRRLLRTIEALPGGTRVQCPQCRTEFATPEDAPEPPPAPRAANIPAVPRTAPKLVDEGWQGSGAAPRDSGPRSSRTPLQPRARPTKSTSRRVVLAFVIICLSLAFLVLIIAMAQKRSEPRFEVPIAKAVLRLQGQWEVMDIDGAPPAWRTHVDFHDDGSGRLWTDNLAQDLRFRYLTVADAELVMETHNLHGAPREFSTMYRIEWLHNDEVRLIDRQNGESFHCRR